MASYTVTYFADFVHVYASATYQLVLVRCMAWICMRSSLDGWGSPENCNSLATYPRTQYVSYGDTVLHSENYTCLGLPHPSGLGRMHTYVMHHANITLLGSGCIDVHRVARYVPVNDATRAAWPPQINYKSHATTIGAPGLSTTMGASVRRLAATNGYRTPHHLTSWEHVHSC